MTPHVLAFVVHRLGRPTPESAFALEQARELDEDAGALVAGEGVAIVARAVAESGVARVHVADGPAFRGDSPQACADAVTALVGQARYDTVLFPGSALALEVAAASAVQLEAGVNWGLLEVRLESGDLVGRRRALDDSVEVEVGWTTPVRLAVLRGTAQALRDGTAGIEDLAVETSPWSTRLRILESVPNPADGATLERAAVVVAGGRGLGGPDGFELLEQLAEALGGAVGASMPAVEAGWYPRLAQIGQSGTTVSPRVYIACGISGAMQHTVGMESSEAIVAVNTDPRAPIFRFCDVGVVADAREFVPRLLALIRTRAGASGAY